MNGGDVVKFTSEELEIVAEVLENKKIIYYVTVYWVDSKK